MDKYNVVVAHYNEDLNWIPNIERTTLYIYGKYYPHDGDYYKQLPFSYALVSNLPNIGREGHTYLHHVITYYDEIVKTPESITAFVQGCVGDHIHHYGINSSQELIPQILSEAEQHSYSRSGLNKWYFGPDSAHHEFRAHQGILKANECFGDWLTKYVIPGEPFPEVEWWVSALFAVKHSEIAKKPKRYYIDLINQLNDLCPESGYYMERAWKYIFTK